MTPPDNAKKLNLDELYPGLTVAKPVFGRDGNILLEEGVVLASEHLQKLIIWDIDEIWVTGFLEEDFEKTEAEERELKKGFVRTHERAVAAIMAQLANMRRGQPMEEAALEEHVFNLFDRLTLDRNLMLNMTLLSRVDDYQFSHCVNVALFSMVCGKHLGYSDLEQINLGKAAFMHDLGMVLLPQETWWHDRALTEEEREVVKSHANLGYEAAQKAGLPKEVCDVIRNHHEFADGTGYPRGLKEDEMDEYSQIVALANVYEGLTSVRPYRERTFTPAEAWRYILTRMKSCFSMKILRAFMGQMAIYPIGSSVRLSTGESAVVVGTNINKPFRPIVKVLYDDTGDRVHPPRRIDLGEDRNWKFHITEPIADNLISEALGL